MAKKNNWLDIKMEEFPQAEFLPLRHPAVLCHGYGSVVVLFQPSPLHPACMLLREHGVIAFAPNIAPYVEIEAGAALWAKILGKVLQMTGAEKLNVIAHSMAGVSLRYAIHAMDLGKIVSSLTTVASPHQGTSLAELALESPEMIQDIFRKLSDRLGNKVYPEFRSNVMGAIPQLTRKYMREKFNPVVRDDPGVSYYSISAAGGKDTDRNIGMILAPYNRYIYKREGINDGFVSEESAHWGTHIGFVKLSHLEQIKMNIPKKQIPVWEKMWLDLVRFLYRQGH